MKRIYFIILFFCFFISSNAQGIAPSSEEILDKAYAQAKAENKNVFVIFHASWCGWCHKMDKSMNDAACKKFFDDNYVITHLVVEESKEKKALENPGANELRTKYYGDGLGIPFWLVFNKNGKLLSDSKLRAVGEGPDKGSNSGCPANIQEVTYFVNVLKNTSNLDAEQLEIIRKRFRENE